MMHVIIISSPLNVCVSDIRINGLSKQSNTTLKWELDDFRISVAMVIMSTEMWGTCCMRDTGKDSQRSTTLIEVEKD